MNRADVELLLIISGESWLLMKPYINYSRQKKKHLYTGAHRISKPIVMQTLSKAWGLAALQLGIAFASMDMIELFNKVKPSYNINEVSAAAGTGSCKTQQVKWMDQNGWCTRRNTGQCAAPAVIL